MCKVIKAKKVGIEASTPHMLWFILDIIILVIFASFLKQNPKSQTNMDEHRHKIFL
jgi:uncharacterized membrane protein